MFIFQRCASAPEKRCASRGRPHVLRGPFVACLAGSAWLVLTAAAMPARLGQEATDAKELKQKVAELVKGLDASKAADRQAAQAELIKLGSAVVPFLPASDADGLSGEQRRRLGEIRSALGQQAGRAGLAASKITLSAKGITLSDAIAALQRQSGNQIVDLREEFGQEVTNPEFAADWKDKPFWEVMDEIAAKTTVGFYLHTGERQIGLVMQSPQTLPTAYAGPLRIALQQIVRRISFENKQKECVLQFEIAWEPRVRPILFEIKPDNLEVVDDLGNKIAVEAGPRGPAAEEEGESLKAGVDGTMIRTDFIVRLAQPNKGASSLKLVRGKLDLLVPANIQTFDYTELAKAKDVKKQNGNVTVTLEKFKELETGLWSAELLLEYDSNSEAFESYETWFYDNEIYLQRADGTRFPVNGGNTLTESADGRVGIEYRFVDAPGKIADYKLIYKAPSTIVRESVDFELKDIELP